MEHSSSYTLSFDNQYTQDMLKTFMACQHCRNVNTKTKQLQCGHTICQKCAVTNSKKHGDKWLIRCSTCSGVTNCHDERMSGLKEIKTVQKLVEKTRAAHDSALFNDVPRRWEDNMSINVVSSDREKQEIRKVLETAKRKMQLCHDQRKLVHNHEKRVQSTKMKLETQIRDSVDAYICAIRTHQDQLLDELNQMFREDFHPIEEAINCLEMQMQSLTLVKECCSVAGRILKGGGAPMDMNNFKKMVRQTMGKTKAGKLPSVMQKSYKPRVFYKTNEDQYDAMAEKIGKLVVRKEKKEQPVKTREVERKETREILVKKEEYREKRQTEYFEDDPIYDIVPPEMAQARRSNRPMQDFNESNSFYDEIPFFREDVFQSNRSGSEASGIIADFISRNQNDRYFPPAPSQETGSPAHTFIQEAYLPPSASQASLGYPPPEQNFAAAYIPPAPPLLAAAQTSQNSSNASADFFPAPPQSLPLATPQIPISSTVPIPPPPPVPIAQPPASQTGSGISSSSNHSKPTSNASSPPAPIPKNNHPVSSPTLQTVSSNPCLLINEDTVAMFAKRRRAINGEDSDSEDSISDLSIFGKD